MSTALSGFLQRQQVSIRVFDIGVVFSARDAKWL